MPPRTDDEFLIRFLRARFFKLEHAYNLVGIFITIAIIIIILIKEKPIIQQPVLFFLISVVPILRVSRIKP